MVANYSLPVRASPGRNVHIRIYWQAHMSVVSALHRLIDELNKPHLHAEVDQEDSPEVAETSGDETEKP